VSASQKKGVPSACLQVAAGFCPAQWACRRTGSCLVRGDFEDALLPVQARVALVRADGHVAMLADSAAA